MRYVLYLLTLAVFALKEIFSFNYVNLSIRLFNYFLILFLIVCVDFSIRLRKSWYIFYPIGYAVGFLINYFGWFKDYDISNFLLSLLNLVLAFLLIRKGILLKKDGVLRIGYGIGAVGILALIFGIQIISYLSQDLRDILHEIYSHPALYAVMLLVSLAPFSLKEFRENFPDEKNLFLFLAFLSLIPLLGLVF